MYKMIFFSVASLFILGESIKIIALLFMEITFKLSKINFKKSIMDNGDTCSLCLFLAPCNNQNSNFLFPFVSIF